MILQRRLNKPLNSYSLYVDITFDFHKFSYHTLNLVEDMSLDLC